MRKLLLGTTAVVGAALIGATGASAQEAPQVRIGGYIDFSAAFISDNSDRGNFRTGALPPAGARRPQQYRFREDMEVWVLVTGKTAGGLTYGARIEFQNDNLGSGGVGTTVDTDEAWIFLSSPTLGTIRVGDTDPAGFAVQVRPPSYPARNRLSWYTARRPATNTLNYVFSGVGDGADNTKIVYLSPSFAGFDFGISYAPNGNEGPLPFAGTGGQFSTRDRSTARTDEISGGVRYRGNFGGVGLAAGFSFITATSPRNVSGATGITGPVVNRAQNPYAMSFGLTGSVAGFTLGGEYTFGKYQGGSVGAVGPRSGARNSWHYLLGASYAFAPFTVTANFGQAYQDNWLSAAGQDLRVTGVGAGVNYVIAPGLSTYIHYEYQRFRGFPGSVGSVTGAATPAGLVGGPGVNTNRTIQGVTAGLNLAF